MFVKFKRNYKSKSKQFDSIHHYIPFLEDEETLHHYRHMVPLFCKAMNTDHIFKWQL